MCSPPQGLRHSSPPSTGSQDDLLKPHATPRESTSLKLVGSLTLALLLLLALGGCALPSARDATLRSRGSSLAMARHRRRQTALSGATGRSRRCASGCSGDTRRWRRRGLLRHDGHAALDCRSGELLPLVGRDAALLGLSHIRASACQYSGFT